MKAPGDRLVRHAMALTLILGGALPVLAQSPPVAAGRVDRAVPEDRGTAPLSMRVSTPPPAGGEARFTPASPEPGWGTTVETSYYVGPPAFHGAAPDVYVVDDFSGSAYFSGTGAAYAWAPINLPQGAAITGYDFYYYDANASQDLSVILWEVDSTGGYSGIGAGYLASSGSPGWGSVSTTLSTPRTVNNNVNSYWAWVLTGTTPVSDLKWRGVRVRYKLQVSPAPGVATFSDVPTNYWAFQYIEALKASGITGGVTPTTYEPESPVTRAQMAVFLAKALGLQWP